MTRPAHADQGRHPWSALDLPHARSNSPADHRGVHGPRAASSPSPTGLRSVATWSVGGAAGRLISVGVGVRPSISISSGGARLHGTTGPGRPRSSYEPIFSGWTSGRTRSSGKATKSCCTPCSKRRRDLQSRATSAAQPAQRSRSHWFSLTRCRVVENVLRIEEGWRTSQAAGRSCDVSRRRPATAAAWLRNQRDHGISRGAAAELLTSLGVRLKAASV